MPDVDSTVTISVAVTVSALPSVPDQVTRYDPGVRFASVAHVYALIPVAGVLTPVDVGPSTTDAGSRVIVMVVPVTAVSGPPAYVRHSAVSTTLDPAITLVMSPARSWRACTGAGTPCWRTASRIRCS
jgi:hypothetical protein